MTEHGHQLRIDAASQTDLERLHPWFDTAANAVPEVTLHRMRVALEEAVLNVARHAYPPPRSGEIVVRLCVSARAATLVVDDTGVAFDPTAAEPAKRPESLLDVAPGGLGLTLLRHFCPDISYRRLARGNRLILRFPLPPQAG